MKVKHFAVWLKSIPQDGPTDRNATEFVSAWSMASLSSDREVYPFLYVVPNGWGIYHLPSVTFSIESSNNPMLRSEKMVD